MPALGFFFCPRRNYRQELLYYALGCPALAFVSGILRFLQDYVLKEYISYSIQLSLLLVRDSTYASDPKGHNKVNYFMLEDMCKHKIYSIWHPRGIIKITLNMQNRTLNSTTNTLQKLQSSAVASCSASSSSSGMVLI